MLSKLITHRCALCDAPTPSVVCANCMTALPYITSACQRCALPTKTNVSACGECLKSSPEKNALDSARAVLRYENSAQWLLRQHKYHKAHYLQACLNQLLTHYIATHPLPEVDAVIAMPMHTRRWLGKGQNHADVLARAVAKQLNMAHLSSVVKKIKHTPRFATVQSKKERAKLIKNAFEVMGDVPKRVLIVDDVMTTGASCDALAHLLKANGAMEVHALVIARVE